MTVLNMHSFSDMVACMSQTLCSRFSRTETNRLIDQTTVFCDS